MKRAFIVFLCGMLLASGALARSSDLKKVLILVPNEQANTGWIKMASAMLITQGGGSYDTYPYHSGVNADSLAARLAQARASGKYGLVIVAAQDRSNLASPTSTAYGHGVMRKFVSIEQAPIGIPTVLIARTILDRATGTYQVLTGVTDGGAWVNGAVGTGNMWDSLKTCIAGGGEALWHHGPWNGPYNKHILNLSGAESSYFWEVDAWVKRGTHTPPGKGATVLLWHVHRTAHDRDELPGQGQDSVIYYMPYFGSAPSVGYDCRIKALAALLKKYNCIRDYEFSLLVDDFAFDVTSSLDTVAVKWYARTDSLTDWCVANSIPIQWNTDIARMDATGPAKMARWAGNPLVHFAWHPTHIYKDGTTHADSAKQNVFVTWPIKVTRDKGKVLGRDLRYTYGRLDAAGWHNYMTGKDEVIFNTRNYTGKEGFRLQDTIFAALASTGVRTFAVSSAYSGYYQSGASYKTIFYPHKQYPLALSGVGGTGTAHIDITMQNYLFAGVSATGDTLYANPATMTDSAIVYLYGIGAGKFYRYFYEMILANKRGKDGTATTWDGSAANWAFEFDANWSGVVIAGHQLDVARRNKGVYHNMLWNWVRHYHGNLDAYNKLARADNPTGIGDAFVWRHLKDQKQRPCDRW